MMPRKLRLAAFAFAIAGIMIITGTTAATPVDGTWAIRDLILDIFGCQNLVCGRVAWTKDPKRRQADCGRTIVWGLSPSGPSEWDGGSIYDPTDGNTYRLKATLNSDGTLHARIFRGLPVFGKTEILRRVAAGSRSGWC